MSERRFSVRITNDVWREATEQLLEDTSQETKGFFLCSSCTGETLDHLLVREYVAVPPDAYVRRSAVIVETSAEFVHGLLVRCATEELALLEIHTHPWAGNVAFSHIDMASDLAKFKVTEQMLPPFRHGSLVLGADLSLDGHLWSPESHEFQDFEVITVLGDTVEKRFGTQMKERSSVDEVRFDRQIRMLGVEGQRELSKLRVGLVGCGGLGSHLAQALGLLGVKHFVLVDPDRLDATSANRFVGATPEDIIRRSPKARVIERFIRKLHGDSAKVNSEVGVVQHGEVLSKLADCDLLVGAVDSPSARQFLNTFAVLHLIPYVDVGVGLRVDGHTLTAGGGQVQIVVPAHTACRACLQRSGEAEAQEQLTPGQRQAARGRGYITGAEVKNPQVVFLNGILANMAAWEIVKLFTGVADVSGYVHFDLLNQHSFVPDGIGRNPDCLICSTDGYLGAGGAMDVSLGDSSEPPETALLVG